MRFDLPKFDLEGKFALITGGAGLLGKEHAKALLKVNCKVIIVDISSKNLHQLKESLCNENCFFYNVDITSESSIEDLSRKLKSQDIRVNILINNAAVDPKVSKSLDNSLEKSRLENFPIHEWQNQINVGLTGAFLCSKIFGTIMAHELNEGIILNIASDLSVISPDQRLYENSNLDWKMQSVKAITYSVIKSGLIGLTKYLATYWVNQNVRCNAISPGGIYVGQDISFVNKLEKLIPLGRMANIDEYHSAIQFLCSEASSYMNGQNLVIDGGRSIW